MWALRHDPGTCPTSDSLHDAALQPVHLLIAHLGAGLLESASIYRPPCSDYQYRERDGDDKVDPHMG